MNDSFARRRWARRWLSWRRALLVLAVLLVVGLGAYAVWFSSWLSAEQVAVTGAEQLTVDEVEQAAGVPLGEPLARVDLDAVRTRVESLAIVRSVAQLHGATVRLEASSRLGGLRAVVVFPAPVSHAA